MLELEHLGRVVALVGDPEHVTSGAEREQQLGGVGDEARDPHAPTVRAAAGEANLARVAVLSDAEIEVRLADLEGWNTSEGAIEREWKLDDFAAAIAFVDRVAELAERANHHPDILIHGWNKVRLTLSTHSEGGLTESDFALAASIDGLA